MTVAVRAATGGARRVVTGGLRPFYAAHSTA